MNAFDSELGNTRSRTLNTILREDYGWTDANFVDGMARVDVRLGDHMEKFWQPKRSFVDGVLDRVLEFFVIEPKISKVLIQHVIKPGVFLRFSLPDEKALATLKPIVTLDVQNWTVFFMHEAKYSFSGEFKQIAQAEKAHHVFGQWLSFESYERAMHDFDFKVKSLDGNVEIRIPTIVFYGAEWVEVAEPCSS